MSPPHNRQIPASPTREENHDVAAAEHQAAFRFDRLIDLIHYIIHGYGSLDLNPDQTFQLAEAVANAIMAIIQWIPIFSQQHPSPKTRLEALTALEEIGNIILWAGPTELGLKVRMHFDCNSVLEWAMLGIVDEMGPEEKLAILDEETHDDHPPLLFRIHQLKEEGRWCLLYDNMHWVINALEDTSLPDEDESYGAGN